MAVSNSGSVGRGKPLKKCKTCLEDKPSTEFYKNKTYPSGRENTCKECRKHQDRVRWYARTGREVPKTKRECLRIPKAISDAVKLDKEEGMLLKDVAKKHNLSISTVWNISRRRTSSTIQERMDYEKDIIKRRALLIKLLNDGEKQSVIELLTGYTQSHISKVKNGHIRWAS